MYKLCFASAALVVLEAFFSSHVMFEAVQVILISFLQIDRRDMDLPGLTLSYEPHRDAYSQQRHLVRLIIYSSNGNHYH